MRVTMILLALASLSACDRNAPSSEGRSTGDARRSCTYEGADYKDRSCQARPWQAAGAVLDCTGCHGANLQGAERHRTTRSYGDMNAPNLTLAARQI